jgi:hypothetical protein
MSWLGFAVGQGPSTVKEGQAIVNRVGSRELDRVGGALRLLRVRVAGNRRQPGKLKINFPTNGPTMLLKTKENGFWKP